MTEIHPVIERIRKERETETVTKPEQPINKPADGFAYWIPKPTLKGWRVNGLLFVNIMAAIGLCCLAILGFVFNQIDQEYAGGLFDSIRWILMLGGSVCVALGSEIGTLVTTVEIFRKQRMTKRRPWLARVLISFLAIARAIQVVRGALSQIRHGSIDQSFTRAVKMIDKTLEREEKGALFWDWLGLFISAITSLSAVALAYVSGMALSTTTYTWLPIVQQWSPAALLLFGVLDLYINHAEFGLFLASFDERVKQWYVDREAAKKEVRKRS